ncbi:hypothetical protein [Chondromyces crocatus]|uniref:Uncharacterized protein n=1 Tax=Chondromyces crocatus TaxID=52 RepID=A0A0K1ENY5_CHOCO|nr:hypothetical protein [Chondromyces crocatus]AKT42367.1 uncharacterized protein CMC5_065930 [Chondromyces crocatus]
MKDDELLRALSRAAREDDPLVDPRWDELAADRLSEEDREALEALARQDPEAQEALKAFAPLGEDVRAATVERALAALTHSTGVDAPEASKEEGPDSARVVRLQGRRRSLMTWVMAASLAAAVAAVWGLGRFGTTAGVPLYELTVVGGEQSTRSAPRAPGEEPPQLGSGSRLELLLRPAEPAHESVAVRAFLATRGAASLSEVRRWEPPVEISPEGAVRIAGTREALFPDLPAGEITVLLVVGAEGKLPEDAAAALRAEREEDQRAHAPFRVLRVRLRLDDGGRQAP